MSVANSNIPPLCIQIFKVTKLYHCIHAFCLRQFVWKVELFTGGAFYLSPNGNGFWKSTRIRKSLVQNSRKRNLNQQHQRQPHPRPPIPMWSPMRLQWEVKFACERLQCIMLVRKIYFLPKNWLKLNLF